MNAVADVIDHLERSGVLCALIGGVALGAHGVARATLDIDLMVVDPVVLDSEFWSSLRSVGSPEIRAGDVDDPLVGVVRLSGGAQPIDVIVGRPWTARMLERRMFIQVSGKRLPIVDRADLILLKLFAAGPQDLLDVQLLLAAEPGQRAAVEDRLADAPQPVRITWEKLQQSPQL
jgi:hypothetical protein